MGWNVPLHLRCKPTYLGPGVHGFAWVRRFIDAIAGTAMLTVLSAGAAVAFFLV